MGSITAHLKRLEHDAFTRAVLAECRRISDLLDIDLAELEEEALRLMANPRLAPVLTPERIEEEREVMYAAARRRCDRLKIDFETVRPEVDRLVDALTATGAAT